MIDSWNGGMSAGMMASGMMPAGFVYGAMDGGMIRSMGPGVTAMEPLSISEAEAALDSYLHTLNNDDLALGEVMIFDNHACAQIVSRSRGTGALEVLVDPDTRRVYPEPGPNMMWNTNYGMMGGAGSRGTARGTSAFHSTPDATIDVTAEEASVLAQGYLNTYLPGKTASETADVFPGYYTLHVLEDEEIMGMLSVNVCTGQVFLHHRHGEFVAMVGEDYG